MQTNNNDSYFKVVSWEWEAVMIPNRLWTTKMKGGYNFSDPLQFPRQFPLYYIYLFDVF